jgi:hypothetical protein
VRLSRVVGSSARGGQTAGECFHRSLSPRSYPPTNHSAEPAECDGDQCDHQEKQEVVGSNTRLASLGRWHDREENKDHHGNDPLPTNQGRRR